MRWWCRIDSLGTYGKVALKHQLNIHLDYGPHCFEAWGLEIRYGYSFSGEHQLREQVIRTQASNLAPELKADLNTIYNALRVRIPEPEMVRLPHAEVLPSIQPAGLTFVILDQSRAAQWPIARLYYYEEAKPLGSRIEKRVYLEKRDWTTTELVVCDRIRESIRKIAWQDYERLMGHHLFGTTRDRA